MIERRSTFLREKKVATVIGIADIKELIRKKMEGFCSEVILLRKKGNSRKLHKKYKTNMTRIRQPARIRPSSGENKILERRLVSLPAKVLMHHFADKFLADLVHHARCVVLIHLADL